MRVPADFGRLTAGTKLIALLHARGVQTYQCTGNTPKFGQPDAILTNRGRPEILHTRAVAEVHRLHRAGLVHRGHHQLDPLHG